MELNRPCYTKTVELIDYIQNNPNTIFHMNEFLIKYQNGIFNFVRLTVRDYHHSMDITNRVLLTLSRKVKEINEKHKFNYLALKVIKGEIKNFWRTQGSEKLKLLKRATVIHNNEELCLFDTIENNENKAEEIFNLLVVRDLIEHSNVPYLNDIFFLRYRDEESIEKIANKLRITEYQVKKSLQQIQAIVKDYLEEA